MLELVESNGHGEALSGAQETAMKALRAGSTFVQAAKLSGVNRATLYRWVQNSPAFRAAYNTWQREVTESSQARLLKLSELAVSVVEKALLDDDLLAHATEDATFEGAPHDLAAEQVA